MPEQDPPRTPFEDLDDYVSLPRLSGLALSPDGIRLVTTVAERSPDGKRYSSSLWEVDPGGQRPARRLTRSAPGEAQPAFLPDGRLLFASRRPDAEAKPDDEAEDRTALWLLPEAGEARLVARRGGDVSELAVARDSGAVVVPGVRAARRRRRRGGRAAPAGPQGGRRHRDPARGPPGPALGPRHRPGRAARAGRRPGAARRRSAHRGTGPDARRRRGASARGWPSRRTAAWSRWAGRWTTRRPPAAPRWR